jgi:hypothetical protein
MIAQFKMRLLLGLLALIFAGVAYSQLPAEETEAVPTSGQYQNFSYNTATGRGTWTYQFTIDDTFGPQLFDITAGPTGTEFIGATGMTCPPGPPLLANPVSCLTAAGVAPPNTLTITFSSPFPMTCAAQVVAIGPVTVSNTNANRLIPFIFNTPASTQSLVAGVATNNVVPANTALCPTPIPNTPVPSTPTPTPTLVPVVVAPPVIPQVFQHVPQGIFNGSRNNTPTPVRPVAAAPAAPVTAMPVLRPPSTGDAGLLTLRSVALNTW